MWKKGLTEELNTLMDQYAQAHHGIEADGYIELNYETMSYEDFAGYIKECLATGKEMPEVVP